MLQINRDVHEAFLVETEARPRPWIPRPKPKQRCWQFKPRQDLDQGLQSSRPRRGRDVPTPRRDRAEALLRLGVASRPRRQDWGHIPHPHHSEGWCCPKKKWEKPRTEAEPKWNVQAYFIYVMLKHQGCAWGLFSGDRGETETLKAWSPRSRPRPRRSVLRPRRDRGIWNFNGGETERRHYCTSRQPRGVKNEATSLQIM